MYYIYYIYVIYYIYTLYISYILLYKVPKKPKKQVFKLKYLKVHQCRFENLPISSSLSENIMLTLKHLLLFEICAREICEKFVYKH